MSNAKNTITKVQSNVVVALSCSPATLLSTQTHTNLTCINFSNSYSSIVGHIIHEDANYLTFKNALTHVTQSFNHSIIASKREVSVFEQITDITEWVASRNTVHKQILKRELFVLDEHDTLVHINEHRGNRAEAFYTEELK